MKKKISMMLIIIVLSIGTITVPVLEAVPCEDPATLFEAIHHGHARGNWDVGIWRHYGDGAQIPYRISVCDPAETIYPGGPINHAGSNYLAWENGNDTHNFTITYNPQTLDLTISVTGPDRNHVRTTVTETTTSPEINPAIFGSCEYVLYEGGEYCKVNALSIVLKSTVGTNVRVAYFNDEKNSPIDYCNTEISNLKLDGTTIQGKFVEAILPDTDPPESFTNQEILTIPVPEDSTWTLTGDLSVQVSPTDGDYVPKESRVGMNVHGVCVCCSEIVQDVCCECECGECGPKISILADTTYVVVGATESESRGLKPPLNTHYAAFIDATGASILLGMSENGKLYWDTDITIIDQTTGGALVGSTVVMSGGPLVNTLVKYYEANRDVEETPLYWKSEGGLFYWYETDGNRLDITGLKANNQHDMFTIEIFQDSQGRNVVIIYGYGGRGTLAGALTFFENADLFNGAKGYWIYEWIDNPTAGTTTHPDPSDMYNLITSKVN